VLSGQPSSTDCQSNLGRVNPIGGADGWEIGRVQRNETDVDQTSIDSESGLI
jgi:hypothetical protein